ncbi:MAG TPA: PEP-CTERM sorting domain-containing protein [Phycisphaerae bacterium]|nr:PEP-CTERM sorting domain-containing protein [Phycisphaerae bacterium]
MQINKERFILRFALFLVFVGLLALGTPATTCISPDIQNTGGTSSDETGTTNPCLAPCPDGASCTGTGAPAPCKFPIPAPSFIGLGDLPGGATESIAYGVSADGAVVVGSARVDTSVTYSGWIAFIWRNGIMTALPKLEGVPFQWFDSWASDVSSDGLVVVGAGRDGDDNVGAFRWKDGVCELLPDIFGETFDNIAYRTSADGHVVVGRSHSIGAQTIGFRIVDSSASRIGGLGASFVTSRALGVSSDGSIVVGSSTNADKHTEAFRWEAGAMIGLGDLPGGDFSSEARAVSDDGSVIFGRSATDAGYEAFRWTATAGLESLGDLPGGTVDCTVMASSTDGTIAVGSGNTDLGTEAFIWDDAHGMRNLREVLTGLGLDLTGWQLEVAMDVSADGKTIVGKGTNPQGVVEAWRAVISN